MDELGPLVEWIGQAIAGNGRLAGGTTLLEKYPERYRNPFTDWVDLLIAEARVKQSLERQDHLDTKILRLDEIIVDSSLNPRIGALDQETILDYSAHVDDLPAMIVFDGRNWPERPGFYLVGGFHRFAAHQLAGRDVAKFVVRHGDRVAAEEVADFDNLTHGLHLTQADKRGITRRYLKRHPDRSNVWIGRDCRVNDKTVATIRKELEEASEIPRLDKLVDRDGVWRPRSIERPQKPDPQAEAEKLMTPLEEAIERAEVEETVTRDAAQAYNVFQAAPCPDCDDIDFYWSDADTVKCFTCGRTWDKLAWMSRSAYGLHASARHTSAGVESREVALGQAETGAGEQESTLNWRNLGMDGVWRIGANTIAPPEWVMLQSDGKWYHKGTDGKPYGEVRKGAFPAPPWYLEMFGLAAPAAEAASEAPAAETPADGPQAWQQFAATPPLAPVYMHGAVSPDLPAGVTVTTEDSQPASEPEPSLTVGTQAADEPEWLAEEGGTVTDDGGSVSDSAGSGSDTEPPKTHWGQPAREFKSTAPVVPPSPSFKPAPPPPPPPVIGRADLVITVTVSSFGRALVSARRGDESVGMYATHQDRAGEQVQEVISKQAVKEEPVNDNAL